MECLVSLARNYNRSIIFTIHQPRSNIFALFDKLILLAKGRLVYSGSTKVGLIQHFGELGYECPIGFNLADYLVDLTMHAAHSHKRIPTDISDTKSVKEEQENMLYSPHQSSQIEKKLSLLTNHQPNPVRLVGEPHPVLLTRENIIKPFLSKELYYLIEGFTSSNLLEKLKADISEKLLARYPNITDDELIQIRSQSLEQPVLRLPNVSGQDTSDIVSNLTGYIENLFNPSNVRSGANHWDQFKVVSSRTFKNLYRNPELLKTHYVISVAAAFICGLLFWKVDDTLAGFQNRLGVFFFICALFGFGCLSSMQVV